MSPTTTFPRPGRVGFALGAILGMLLLAGGSANAQSRPIPGSWILYALVNHLNATQKETHTMAVVSEETFFRYVANIPSKPSLAMHIGKVMQGTIQQAPLSTIIPTFQKVVEG